MVNKINTIYQLSPDAKIQLTVKSENSCPTETPKLVTVTPVGWKVRK